MQVKDYFKLLVKDIHTVIAATADDDGLPVTCAIDMMDYDEKGLYFLTACGKGFYRRLKKGEYIALTGIKGEDTMSRAALSVRGTVEELGAEKVTELFDKNPYMYRLYPDAESQKVIRVFRLYRGAGDWFDLSRTPVQTAHFTFGEDGQ